MADRTACLTRRSWLQLATMATTGCGVMRYAADTDAVEQTDRCTLGFSTYGMKSLSTERAIDVLSEIGYSAVEIAVRSGWDADSAKMQAPRRKALRRRLQDASLRVSSLMEHVYPADDQQQQNALQRLKLACRLAHDLSPQQPPLIQTVLGGGVFTQQKNQLRDRLGAWVEIANQAKVTIAIKPHRGGVVSQPAEAIWLFEQLGKPERLRMVYDYSHYAFRALPLEQTVRTALPYTAHIAAKDAVQEGTRVVFRLPGATGTTHLAEIIRQFHAGGYRGDVNCEVSGMVWGKPNYDPIAAARTCYANMQQAFGQAGVEHA